MNKNISKPNILLLHPPGVGKTQYQLDGYCSQPQKGPYRWHPLDFCCFSPSLSKNANVDILDFMDSSIYFSSKVLKKYDYIIGLIGAFGFQHQKYFWNNLIEELNIPIFLSGDLARYEPTFIFKNIPRIKGIIPELSMPPELKDMEQTDSHKIWYPGNTAYKIPLPVKNFHIGIQDFSKWNHNLYRLPFVNKYPFASVITQVGCPYKCNYCILSSYNLSLRNYDELEEELCKLKKDGAKHVYFRDATLNSSDAHLQKICSIMQKIKLDWHGFFRINDIGKHASNLKEAHCKHVQIGFDSLDLKTLKDYGKNIPDNFKDDLNLLEKHKISTSGHFMYGLEIPPISPMEIANYAHNLNLSWLTISPVMERPGTIFWNIENLQKINEIIHNPKIGKAMRRFYFKRKRILTVLKLLLLSPIRFLKAAFESI